MVLVIVEVSSVFVVEVSTAELDDAVMAPAWLLPEEELLLEYEEALADMDVEQEELLLAEDELEAAGTTLLVDEEAEVEAAPALEADGTLLLDETDAELDADVAGEAAGVAGEYGDAEVDAAPALAPLLCDDEAELEEVALDE